MCMVEALQEWSCLKWEFLTSAVFCRVVCNVCTVCVVSRVSSLENRKRAVGCRTHQWEAEMQSNRTRSGCSVCCGSILQWQLGPLLAPGWQVRCCLTFHYQWSASYPLLADFLIPLYWQERADCQWPGSPEWEQRSNLLSLPGCRACLCGDFVVLQPGNYTWGYAPLSFCSAANAHLPMV